MLLNKKSLFIPLVLLICSCNTGYQPIQSKSIFIANDVDVRFAELVHKRFFHEIKTEQNTALIALTHDPKIDDPALQHALKNNFFYIGALGSKKTHANRCTRLKEAGFSDEQISKIFGPIGIKLGGKSAPEIALSIIAQLVSEVYNK